MAARDGDKLDIRTVVENVHTMDQVRWVAPPTHHGVVASTSMGSPSTLQKCATRHILQAYTEVAIYILMPQIANQ